MNSLLLSLLPPTAHLRGPLLCMSANPVGLLPALCRCALLGDNLAVLAEKNGCARPVISVFLHARTVVATIIMACCRGLLVVRCTYFQPFRHAWPHPAAGAASL